MKCGRGKQVLIFDLNQYVAAGSILFLLKLSTRIAFSRQFAGDE
jgi:hypothetical protein